MKYVFLHGMGQNAASWEKTISFLPEGTEAVCPELSDFFTEFYLTLCGREFVLPPSLR